MRPSVLAITSELPWPLDSGGRLRTFHVQRALAAAFEHRLIVPVRPEQMAHVATLKAKGINVIAVPVPPRTKLGELKRLLCARWRGEPYVLYGRHAHKEMFAAVATELARQKPDIVWLDHLDSLLFEPIARGSRAKTFLDVHNVYSDILRRLANTQQNKLKRWFFNGEARRLRKMEDRAVICDAIITVSERDAWQYTHPFYFEIIIAPNGVDCAAFASLPTGRTNAKPVVLFLGTLSWGPNVSAAIRLAKEIFPKVRAQIPAAELWLVGRDPSAEVKALAGPGVTVAGSVPSIEPYLRDAALLAVPLDAGGGTRLKILEAFAAGLPVVSTPVGTEGIDAADDAHLIIAECEAMAAAIVQLLNEPKRGGLLAANARRLVREKYDWQSIGAICVEAVKSCIKKNV